MYDTRDIMKKIKKMHSDDNRQLEIIFDDNQRILVEAPAGCGKTTTMISKIAYILSTNGIPSTKKILALTFSVNAAYKIKKDIFEKLPIITNCSPEESIHIANKICVANYHSFSRRILNFYGKNIINDDLNIKSDNGNWIPIDDANEEILHLHYGISLEIARFVSDFNKAVKECDIDFVDENWNIYNDIVRKAFIPKGYITYNAIILLTYELFVKFPEIKRFYNNYFPIIFVDEFQDTNYICWKLLKEVICDKTRIVFMGDPLQRIYGFIGAIPNIMTLAEKKYNMKRYELFANYRFKDNEDMLLLDKNIRLNAKILNNYDICKNANPSIIVASDQDEEARWICNKVREFKKLNERVAVLVRTGISNPNTQCIVNKMRKENISLFSALFTDNDIEYDKFHEVCLFEFNKVIARKEVINSKILDKFINNVKAYYENSSNEIIVSLIKLLEIFCNRIPNDYNYLKNEDMVSFIQDTFINKGLKQNMDKVNEDVILATIHAFKGLEYQNIIIADNEKHSFPNYKGVCEFCNQNRNLNCIKRSINYGYEGYYDELSVFYVGFTRAINKVYFTLSKKRLNSKCIETDAQPSCFLKLKGISYQNLIDIS